MQPFEDRDVTIHVSDSSLMHLVLAGMEAYKMRAYKGRSPLETGGLLWGHVKDDTNGTDHITVEHVSTDTDAERTPDSIALSERTTQIKREMVQDRWPNLSLVGDFHTHPYKSYGQALREKGWQFSDGDYQWYQEDRTRESWPGRVGLVLAIAELKKNQGYQDPRVRKRLGNTIQWQQCQYRFWLSAYAIDNVGDRLIVSPPNPHGGDNGPLRSYVFIDVPTINGTSEWFSYQ